MITAVLFDLYGTLVDVQTDESSLPPYERLAEWLNDRKIRANPADLKTWYSEGCDRLRAAITDPNGDIDVTSVFKEIYIKLGVAKPTAVQVSDLAYSFRKFTRVRCALLPGANDLIFKLKQDYLLGIVTNSQELFTLPELEELRFREPFRAITLSSKTGLRKPSTTMFEVALQDLEVSPDEAVYVGCDMSLDIAGAKAVGLRALYMPNASVKSTADVQPDGKLSRLGDVSKFLDQWKEPDAEDDLVDDEEMGE